jgi:alkanesulfonate monooxygenase SsuD/methylene tetrahydromethanopterin reductase-like flavin-dependent oxidoreductase (luciferase family)
VTQETTFGYLACQQVPDATRRATLVDEIVAEAQLAEAVGYRSVFVSEHHQRPDNFFPSPLILATVLARETAHIDVGVGVAVLPLYQPLRLVEDATCIDIVAKGRFILGLGPGYVPLDLELYGMDKDESLERYTEGLEIVAHGWQRNWSFNGKWYRAKITGITPPPVTEPRPRLWIAANTRTGVERAARLADAWIIGARASLSSTAAPAARYREACTDAGRPATIAVIRDAWIAESDTEAYKAIAPYLLTTHLERVHGGFIKDPAAEGVDPTTAGEGDFYRIAEDRWLVGSRDRVVHQLERWRASIGATHFILRFRHPIGPSHQTVLAQIRTFAERMGTSKRVSA